MFEIKGKYTKARVMTDDIDKETTSQIVNIVNHPAFTNDISIMPDTHGGVGSVIGFTMPMSDKIVPNTIGVDIGCGMLSVELEISTSNIESLHELEVLDNDIRDNVPMGINVRDETHYKMEKCFPWEEATRLNKLACLLFNRRTKSSVHPVSYNYEKFLKKCEDIKIDPKRVINSIGTLGGGK
jgi:tRNA-splicing ligase RtcB (3'-phosphate/5'-hydroxy nucleic acid ligase)